MLTPNLSNLINRLYKGAKITSIKESYFTQKPLIFYVTFQTEKNIYHLEIMEFYIFLNELNISNLLTNNEIKNIYEEMKGEIT